MSSFYIPNRARKTMVPYDLGGTPNRSKYKSGLTQRWRCYTLATKVKKDTEQLPHQRQTAHKFLVKLSLSCMLQNTWFHWNWNEKHSHLKAMLPFRPQTVHWMTASQPLFSKMSFTNTQMKKSRNSNWKVGNSSGKELKRLQNYSKTSPYIMRCLAALLGITFEMICFKTFWWKVKLFHVKLMKRD